MMLDQYLSPQARLSLQAHRNRQAQSQPPELTRRAKQERGQPSDPAAWITTHFYIPETLKPITLAPYQQAVLTEALSRDERGLFRYSTIVWSDLKKSAKTTIAAAVVMWMAFSKPGARIRLVGNDLKQADSRVFYAITESIRLNPEWRASIKTIQHKVYLPNDSIIESVAVDPGGEAGGNDDMLEWTELWAATQTAHKKLWAELTLSPTKFGQSFRWIDTYAGYSGESEILESLYAQGVQKELQIDLGIPGLEVYADRNARLFVLWNTQVRLDWQTQEYYRQETTSLTDSEFRRMHKNEWITSSDTFVPAEWWNACKVTNAPPVETHLPMVIALDAGVSSDCFGMLMLSRRDVKDGKGNVRHILTPRYARAWKPPKGGQLDFDSEIEPELRRLVKENYIAQVCYDPYQLHSFCTRLQRDMKVHFSEFNQGTDRAIADKQLRDLIIARQIEHQGEAELTEHVTNANAKTEGEHLRLVKRSATMKIDLAVCLGMASARILKLW
jgi:phage terminase large subunit-like protein